MYDLKKLRPLSFGNKTRVGKLSDGGYVLLGEHLENTRVLLSFGVATDWSFEEEFSARAGGPAVFMFDYATSLPLILMNIAAKILKFQWAKAAHYCRAASGYVSFIVLNDRVKFFRKYLALRNGPRDLTFGDVIGLAGGPSIGEGEVFVKLDIEGGEYDLLPVILEHSARINGMAIEFHELDRMGDRFGEIMGMLDDRFAVAHVHGNNYTGLIPGTALPRSIEVTLVNRSLAATACTPDRGPFPRPGLDYPNDPAMGDYQLDFS